MLTMILHILSMIGWVLLGILGLFVILLLLILFFPIFYDASGLRSTEISGQVRLKAGWLFGLLRVRFTWPEDDGRILIKLLFFTLYDSKAPKKSTPAGQNKKEGSKKFFTKKNETVKETAAGKKQSPEESQQPKKIDSDSAKTAHERLKSMTSKEPKQDISKDTDKVKDTRIEQEQATAEKQRAESSSQNKDASKNPPPAAKHSVFDKILNLYHRFRYTISHLCATIKKLKGQADYYLALLQEEETKQLFSHVKMRLFKVFRSIRPRSIKGHVTFGTGSPDTTGLGMAVYGMFSPLLGKNILVTPDFEEACLYGDLRLKGHITIGMLLYQGIRLLLDKKLRRFIKKMKQGGSDNGR